MEKICNPILIKGIVLQQFPSDPQLVGKKYETVDAAEVELERIYQHLQLLENKQKLCNKSD